MYAEHLDALARSARAATAAGDGVAALAAWREARDLLPPGTRQHAVVTDKVNELSRQVDTHGGGGGATVPPASPAKHGSSKAARVAAGAGAMALLLWKLKFVVVFVVTKGKLLLLGLTKSSTLFSMLLSAGVYWTVWGWKFAFGLVISIYIHEMGHVAALGRFGFKATAPMFIPGLGALIRLRQHPTNAREDARIGLAGPIWGLGAALAALGLWLATGQEIFGAIGKLGAWVNLFNLLPFGPLDGGRGFRPMSRRQQWLVTAAIGATWFASGESLLVLLLIAAIVRAATADRSEPGDATATFQYVTLLIALTAISKVPVNAGV